MRKNKVTLKLDSKEVPLAQFKSLVTAFLDLIDAVSKEATPSSPIKWSVSVRSGSQIVEAYASSEDVQTLGDVIGNSIPNGLKILEKGCDDVPRHFNNRSVKAAQRLASHRGTGDKVVPITIRTGRKLTAITSKTMATADNLMGYSYQSYGSIEGRLKVMADSEGGVKFAIYQNLYRKSVSCLVPDELVEEAAKFFRKRVTVSGRIQYDRNGGAAWMRVSSFEPLPENEELPKLSELRGILS